VGSEYTGVGGIMKKVIIRAEIAVGRERFSPVFKPFEKCHYCYRKAWFLDKNYLPVCKQHAPSNVWCRIQYPTKKNNYNQKYREW
jgi:hypothetical protein